MADELLTVEQIAEAVRANTTHPLIKTGAKAVPGEGNAKAEIVFIGEAPGFHEDKLGRPFVGNAGQFLEQMLANIGLQRADVYITNIVKWRPPENRDPEPEEIEAAREYLEAELKAINPTLIVCLGRHSMEHFLPGLKISIEHGRPKKRGTQYILPLYHPAAALHNGALRQTLMDDFAKIPKVLIKINEIKNQATSANTEEQDKENLEQLSLL